MRKSASLITLVLLTIGLSACGFGSIKTETMPQQGNPLYAEAHFVPLFKSYTELGANACNASMGVAGAKVDASLAEAVTSLAALADKLSGK